MLRQPASQAEAGRWRFSPGGRVLTVDFLGDAHTMCRVDDGDPDEAVLEAGFIAWPRMAFLINGVEFELVSTDARVLRNHHSRPHHQEEAYTPGPPDPFVGVIHRARVAQVRRLLSGDSLVVMAGPWADFEQRTETARLPCERDRGR